MKTILALIPPGNHAEFAYSHMKKAISLVRQDIIDEISLLGEEFPIPYQMDTAEEMLSTICTADIIIADITGSEPNTMYELGLAHGKSKPVIFITSETYGRLIDIVHFSAHHYRLLDSDAYFQNRLARSILRALNNPEDFLHPQQKASSPDRNRKTVFVSYSHVNGDCLKRLQIHLQPLVKDGLVEVWDDSKIKSGMKWREQIKLALDRAGVAALLISADFLASSFIIENELPPLLKSAKDRGTTILPIILTHCGFLRDKNLSDFLAVNDPKQPLLTLPEVMREEIYDKVAERIMNDLTAL